MRDPFQASDPIPRELGKKIEEPQWMTPKETKAIRESIFERSPIYDLELIRRDIEMSGEYIVLLEDC